MVGQINGSYNPSINGADAAGQAGPRPQSNNPPVKAAENQVAKGQADVVTISKEAMAAFAGAASKTEAPGLEKAGR